MKRGIYRAITNVADIYWNLLRIFVYRNTDHFTIVRKQARRCGQFTRTDHPKSAGKIQISEVNMIES